MEKQKYPEIRFKGFDEAWRLQKLEEVGAFNPSSSLPQSFEYVDLESVVGTELLGSRNETIDSAPSRAQRLACKGDVFYQAVRPYQKNNYLFDLNYDNYVFSTGYIQIRPNINSRFLLNLVQKNDFVLRVLENCTGTSYPAINTTGLKNIEAFISSHIDEQGQIGEFFQNLDQSIALHDKKLTQTQNFKKAMLEKMFPKHGSKRPEIRLKGFSGDWIETNIGNISTSFSGGTPTVLEKSFYGGEIPFIRSGEISNSLTELFLTKHGLENSSAKMVAKGTILYALYGATSGEVSISLINGAINQAVLAINPADKKSTLFIASWLRLNKTKILETYLQGGQGNLSGQIVKNLKIQLPNSSDEQLEIGQFFKQLDDAINLQKQQLQTLKNLKQAFLEKMFV